MKMTAEFGDELRAALTEYLDGEVAGIFSDIVIKRDEEVAVAIAMHAMHDEVFHLEHGYVRYLQPFMKESRRVHEDLLQEVYEKLEDLDFFATEDRSYIGPPRPPEWQVPESLRVILETQGWKKASSHRGVYHQEGARVDIHHDKKLLPRLEVHAIRSFATADRGRDYLDKVRKAMNRYELLCRTGWGQVPE